MNVKWETDQRFITLPEKLPQFWHCTVMCSAPLSCELKAAQSLTVAMPPHALPRHTVRPACEEEEHVDGACALQMRSQRLCRVRCASRTIERRRCGEVELCASCGSMDEARVGWLAVISSHGERV